jgi:hypothetical protein
MHRPLPLASTRVIVLAVIAVLGCVACLVDDTPPEVPLGACATGSVEAVSKAIDAVIAESLSDGEAKLFDVQPEYIAFENAETLRVPGIDFTLRMKVGDEVAIATTTVLGWRKLTLTRVADDKELFWLATIDEQPPLIGGTFSVNNAMATAICDGARPACGAQREIEMLGVVDGIGDPRIGPRIIYPGQRDTNWTLFIGALHAEAYEDGGCRQPAWGKAAFAWAGRKPTSGWPRQ